MRLWIVIVAGLLGACGGGGGGGGGSPGGGTPGGNNGGNIPTPNLFLPIDSTIQLTYSNGQRAASFESAQQRGSDWVAPFVYATGGKEYYISTTAGVSFAGFYAPTVSVSGAGTYSADARFDTPVVLFRSDETTQQTAQVSGAGTVTISPTYGARPLTYSGTVAYLGTTSVRNSLGTFESKHVRLNLTVSTTIEGNRIDVPFFVDYWFAPDLGIVQRYEQSMMMTLTRATGPDRDGDGLFDGLDALPDDGGETLDLDRDGIGNNRDTDDDNDSVADADDRFPLDAAESADFDGDGVGDNADTDDDNDGVRDAIDPFPYNIHNQDTDGDRIADNEDEDDDNDGVADVDDALPRNPGETIDTDADGIGNNADTDDDNDSHPDASDAYPLNAERWQLLSAGQPALDMQGVYGSAAAPVALLPIVGENIPWQAQSSQPWLELSAGAGVGNATLVVSVNVSGLALGVHTASIVIADTGEARTVEVPVQVSLISPELSVTSASLSFDGEFGWTDVTRPIDVTLNTGLNTHPVSISVSFDVPDAVTATYAEGVASFDPRRLNVTVHPEMLTGGRHTGQLTISADVNGHQVSRTLPLEVLASERVLYPSHDGVALARVATRNSLTRTVTILDSYGIAGTEWTAISDQPWLHTSASGVSGGALTITADPSALTEGFYRGVITISSNDQNVQRTRDISVSLLVDDTAPSQALALDRVYSQIVSDPLRPYAYAHNGSNTIDVYHVHDRVALAPITGLTGVLGPMVTSSDGRWLFVLNPTDGSVTRIDLENTSVGRATWPLTELKPAFGQPATLAYARPHGQPVLFLGDRRVVDAEAGSVYPVGPLSGIGNFEVARPTPQGDRICIVTTGQSPFSGSCFALLLGTYGTADVRTGSQRSFTGFSVPGAGFATDLAVAADGHSVIVGIQSNRTPLYRFQISPNDGFSGPVLAADPDNTSKGARGVAVGSDGVIYADVISNADGYERLYAFNIDGTIRINPQINETSVTGVFRQLVVSGDGMAAIYLTGSSPPLPSVSTQLRFLRPY